MTLLKTAPSREEIFAQLSRILRSQTFRNSEMLRNFLSFIVREKLDGSETNIKQYSIAVKAFGRSPNFDATSDPIVRIQASRLRRNLDIYYLNEGKEDTISILLPVGSYIPEIALVTTAESVEEKVKTNTKATTSSTYSIAVFPIRNLSVDQKMQLVVDGFTEELLSELARYQHLHVIRAIEELNPATRSSLARFSLEGSLRFGETEAKLSLTLTDNYSYEILWILQRKFDYKESDIINLQEEIAASVAQQISGISGIVSQKLLSESTWESTHNPTAYDTYLHFYKYTFDNSPENAAKLLEKVSKMVETEPDFAPGLAILSRLYSDGYIYGLDPSFPGKALECGKKGVELQPNNQTCQSYYAYALMINDQYREAKKHCNLAVELNPNSIHYTGAMGFLYCMMDEQDKGLKLINRSISMDFRYPWWFHVGTYIYHLNRNQYESALIEANKCDKTHFWCPLVKLVACYKLGQEEMAVKHLQDLIEIKADFFDHPQEYIYAILKSVPARKVMLESLTKVIDLSQALHQ